jgi:hypothetical protein
MSTSKLTAQDIRFAWTAGIGWRLYWRTMVKIIAECDATLFGEGRA